MAPKSVGALDLELWTQFEEGIEVPRPLRIIKRSGTYTSADGSIALDEGALIIPRRRSSRTISTNTVGSEQEGPFGRLTIHKRRGRGLSSALSGSSPRYSSNENSIEQLLEELLSGVSSRTSDWIEECREPDFQGRNWSQSSTFFPPHQLAKFPTTEDPQNPSFIRTGNPPESSSSSLSSSDTLRTSGYAEKTSFFKRALYSFPRSKKSSVKKKSQLSHTALRELNTSQLNTHYHQSSTKGHYRPSRHLDDSNNRHFTVDYQSALPLKENLRRPTDTEEHKPSLHLREALRRSSTVSSLHNIFRKLSNPRCSSSKLVQPLSLHPFDTPTITPSLSTAQLKMQIRTPQTVDDPSLAAAIPQGRRLYDTMQHSASAIAAAQQGRGLHRNTAMLDLASMVPAAQKDRGPIVCTRLRSTSAAAASQQGRGFRRTTEMCDIASTAAASHQEHDPFLTTPLRYTSMAAASQHEHDPFVTTPLRNTSAAAAARQERVPFATLGMTVFWAFDHQLLKPRNSQEWFKLTFFPTCHYKQRPCHQVLGCTKCEFPTQQVLPTTLSFLTFDPEVCSVIVLHQYSEGSNGGPCSFTGGATVEKQKLLIGNFHHGQAVSVAVLLQWKAPRRAFVGQCFATVHTKWTSSEHPVANNWSTNWYAIRLGRSGGGNEVTYFPTVEVEAGEVEAKEEAEEAEDSKEADESSALSCTLYMADGETCSGDAALGAVRGLLAR